MAREVASRIISASAAVRGCQSISAFCCYLLAAIIYTTVSTDSFLVPFCSNPCHDKSYQAGTRRSGMRSAGILRCSTFRGQELHYVTDHLPSPAHASGTACQPAFVTRHCLLEHLQHCWKLTCLFNGCGACVFELAPEKCTIWYDIIWYDMVIWFPSNCTVPGMQRCKHVAALAAPSWYN